MLHTGTRQSQAQTQPRRAKGRQPRNALTKW
jgi:hypothetical protein